MKHVIISLSAGLWLTLGWPHPSTGGDALSESAIQSTTTVAANAMDPDMPVYKPRKESRPRARLGGRIRGEGQDPEVAALVPDHVAFSGKQKPTLYWYLSQPTTLPIRFTLNDMRVARPVVDASISSPLQSGIHRIQLQDYGLSLEADVQYMWAISLIRDPESPSQDIASGGIIETVEYAEACMLGPCICKREDVYRYAKEGFWYDAIACISDLIEAVPKDRALRALRASLLEQAGLYEVARWDLTQNGSSGKKDGGRGR
jgi:hypothetical protein